MSSREESVEQANQPTLCTNCNSFFSNAACNDLCSKCHREKESAEIKTAAGCASIEALVRGSPARFAPKAAAAAAAAPTESLPAPSTSACPPADDGASAPPGKSGPSRCKECRKKIGLCGFKCKCGELFCGQHRYAEAHSCGFDYKTTERAKLTEANPVVSAAKVQKL